jgi:hypothetical protein
MTHCLLCHHERKNDKLTQPTMSARLIDKRPRDAGPR